MLDSRSFSFYQYYRENTHSGQKKIQMLDSISLFLLDNISFNSISVTSLEKYPYILLEIIYQNTPNPDNDKKMDADLKHLAMLEKLTTGETLIKTPEGAVRIGGGWCSKVYSILESYFHAVRDDITLSEKYSSSKNDSVRKKFLDIANKISDTPSVYRCLKSGVSIQGPVYFQNIDHRVAVLKYINSLENVSERREAYTLALTEGTSLNRFFVAAKYNNRLSEIRAELDKPPSESSGLKNTLEDSEVTDAPVNQENEGKQGQKNDFPSSVSTSTVKLRDETQDDSSVSYVKAIYPKLSNENDQDAPELSSESAKASENQGHQFGTSTNLFKQLEALPNPTSFEKAPSEHGEENEFTPAL